jgi:hypothetical protein
VSALAEVAAAVDPALQPYTLAAPPQGEWERRLPESPHRAFTLEAVYEGYLLHYGEPRAFAPDMDRDLRLLAGDALYALGLDRLAQHGDLDAVAELADLISLCARAQAEGRPELVPALWEASVQALSPAGGPGARERFGAIIAESGALPLEHRGS